MAMIFIKFNLIESNPSVKARVESEQRNIVLEFYGETILFMQINGYLADIHARILCAFKGFPFPMLYRCYWIQFAVNIHILTRW